MKTIYITLKIFLLFTVLTGVIYPLFITGIAQVAFPGKANGSFISVDNKIVGSELIGQKFDSIIYFSSRPSSISYNPMPSGGSNYSMTNTLQKKLFKENKNHFISFNGLDSLTLIPAEMLFASSSGLDPDISPEAAFLQVERISKARCFDRIRKERLVQTINDMIKRRQFELFGEVRINVLMLNLELDKL